MKARRGEPRQFFDAALQQQTDECIVWPYTLQQGYGRMWDNDRQRSLPVSHLICERAYGPCPDGMQAAHGPCHNRACVNPRHLSWETVQEQRDDQVRDGSRLFGERVAGAKLTERDVREIHQQWVTGEWNKAQLAREFGVDRGLIRLILTGRVWRHVSV